MIVRNAVTIAVTGAVALGLTACGDDEDTASSLSTVVDDLELVPGASTTTTTAPPDVPVVSLPDAIPTELVVTDLVVGTARPPQPGTPSSSTTSAYGPRTACSSTPATARSRSTSPSAPAA
jgi:hypothetical protein